MCIARLLYVIGPDKQKVLYGTKNGMLGLVSLGTESSEIYWEIATKTYSGEICKSVIIGQFTFLNL